MTLPWFVSPWAEVRRLREEIRRCEMNYKGLNAAWREERRDGFRLAKENGILKRQIAKMEIELEDKRDALRLAVGR